MTACRLDCLHGEVSPSASDVEDMVGRRDAGLADDVVDLSALRNEESLGSVVGPDGG